MVKPVGAVATARVGTVVAVPGVAAVLLSFDVLALVDVDPDPCTDGDETEVLGGVDTVESLPPLTTTAVSAPPPAELPTRTGDFSLGRLTTNVVPAMTI